MALSSVWVSIIKEIFDAHKKMSFMLSVTNKPYTPSVVMLCVKAPAETGNRYVLISADSDKNSISNIFRKKKM